MKTGKISLGNGFVSTILGWTCAVFIVVLETRGRYVWPREINYLGIGLLMVGALGWDLWPPRRRAVRNLISPLLFSLTFVLCLWLLFHGWRNGNAEWYSAGPVTPYSDASEYVSGAKSLITFGELGEISARRPLATNIIAVALWITSQAHQEALILLALLTALATFCAVRQTWLAGGLTAALLYLGLALLVLAGWIDIFMTERAGFIFASFSYAVLLHAFRGRSFKVGLAGIGLLVLAQLARPGAILSIVTVGGYLIYYLGGAKRIVFGRAAAIAGLVLVLLVYDSTVSRSLGPKIASYQGNISFSLYGLAAGGKPWYFVLTEHPEVSSMASDGDQSRYVYGLFWKQVTTRPQVLLGAILQKGWTMVRHPGDVLFGLVTGVSPAIPATLGLLGVLILIPGMVSRGSEWTFLAAAFFGIVFSAPFLFDGGSRIYMSIVPFLVGLCIVPITYFLGAVRRRWTSGWQWPNEISDEVPFDLASAILVLLIATALPFWIAHRAKPESIALAVQKTGLASDEGVFFFDPGSGFQLVGEAKPGVLRVPAQFADRKTHFASDFDLSSYMTTGNFLCHGFLLVHPVEHQDIIQCYMLFDQAPRLPRGYLIVSLQFLEQKGASALYKVVNYRRLDV